MTYLVVRESLSTGEKMQLAEFDNIKAAVNSLNENETSYKNWGLYRFKIVGQP